MDLAMREETTTTATRIGAMEVDNATTTMIMVKSKATVVDTAVATVARDTDPCLVLGAYRHCSN
jgi:hypothetical protein